MLRPILNLLGSGKVILASGSPRRKDILQNIGFPFEVVPSGFEENIDKYIFTNLWEYAVATAKGKAREVAERMKDDSSWRVIIAADTIVVKDGVIYEKPQTEENARQMLNSFNNSQHVVYTGVVLVYRPRLQLPSVTKERSFYDSTEVTFGDISNEVIDAYVDSEEPFDKAGGYGIQALGGTLVSSINGDYYNVQGLPLHRTCVELYSVLQVDI